MHSRTLAQLRPLGYKGVLALQRMGLDFKDDAHMERSKSAQQAEEPRKESMAEVGTKHKRMRSRGSFDFNQEIQKREEAEQAALLGKGPPPIPPIRVDRVEVDARGLGS